MRCWFNIPKKYINDFSTELLKSIQSCFIIAYNIDAYCIYYIKGVVLTNSMQSPTILPKGKVGTNYFTQPHDIKMIKKYWNLKP